MAWHGQQCFTVRCKITQKLSQRTYRRVSSKDADSEVSECHHPSVKPWVEQLLPELIDFRRDVHRNPELSFAEYRTTEMILAQLRAAGLQPVPMNNTGAWVDVGRGELAIGLRADIDALPVLEETGLPYASVNEGVAHACGHDIHTTVMLGAALTLKKLDDEGLLNARVRVIFQPAEEKIPGGALSVIEQGVLDEVPRILALHCDPRIDVGRSAPASGQSPRPATPSALRSTAAAGIPRART